MKAKIILAIMWMSICLCERQQRSTVLTDESKRVLEQFDFSNFDKQEALNYIDRQRFENQIRGKRSHSKIKKEQTDEDESSSDEEIEQNEDKKYEEIEPNEGTNYEEIEPNADKKYEEIEPNEGKNYEELEPNEGKNYEELEPNADKKYEETELREDKKDKENNEPDASESKSEAFKNYYSEPQEKILESQLQPMVTTTIRSKRGHRSKKKHRSKIARENDEEEERECVLKRPRKKKRKKKKKKRHYWDNWTEWSPCSVTCGRGRRIRWRKCIAKNCTTGDLEMGEKTCQLPACNLITKLLGL